MIDAAAAAGASAVKVQTFKADELVASHCPAPAHVPAGSLREFFKQFELDRAAHIEIVTRAKLHGLAVVATPFSTAAIDMLMDIGVDALKIASGDLTYDELIAHAARTGLPVIMSTGMSTLAETAHAVSVARAEGTNQLAILHCVSAYPVLEGSQNLRAIQTLSRVFGTLVGLSDHARDSFAVPIAVTLGASIYERHLILPGDDGVDRAVSSTPEQTCGNCRGRSPHAGGVGPWTSRVSGDGGDQSDREPACAAHDAPPGCRRRHRGGRHRGAAPLARVAAESEKRARGNDRGARDRGRRAISGT